MATRRLSDRERQFGDLLKLDHTLNGGVLVGLDGHFIEIQARATEVLRTPQPLTEAATITGMATGAVRESLQRIGGAYAKLGIPRSDVKVLVNLAPADLPKYGTWLDLPLAVILLQAAGYLPDLPDHKEGSHRNPRGKMRFSGRSRSAIPKSLTDQGKSLQNCEHTVRCPF